MKYKIGNMVKIIPVLEYRKEYEAGFVDSMVRYLGELTTITSVNIYSNNYRLKIDCGDWEWSEDMFVELKTNRKR